MRGALSRFRAIAGLSGTQLVHHRQPTVLAVLGVAVAVVLMTVLSGMGYGITTAGTEGLAWLEQDLWISAGALTVAPGKVGGVDNPIMDAHDRVTEIEARSDVRSAGAMTFQSVYVSEDGDEFRTLVGVGIAGNGTIIDFQGEDGLPRSDVHYADGSYSGPMAHEVVIDERTAAVFDVTVGDTLYIGGTLSTAREHEYTVVGIRSTFGTFLGTATVTLPLSELQTLTHSTGSDPASLITVAVEPGADPLAVEDALERRYPTYDVRTNREQLQAALGRQSSILASAVVLVAISIIVGMALVVNVLGMLVYHQRRELLALKASGISSATLVAVVGGQGVAIGLLGGGVGLAIAPLVAALLNPVLEQLAGFPTLIKLPWWILGVGGGLAIAIGVIGAIAAGSRIVRLQPHTELRQ